MIDLRTCPNCGVDAIVVEEGTKPNEVVSCNNCQYLVRLKELQKKQS